MDCPTCKLEDVDNVDVRIVKPTIILPALQVFEIFYHRCMAGERIAVAFKGIHCGLDCVARVVPALGFDDDDLQVRMLELNDMAMTLTDALPIEPRAPRRELVPIEDGGGGEPALVFDIDGVDVGIDDLCLEDEKDKAPPDNDDDDAALLLALERHFLKNDKDVVTTTDGDDASIGRRGHDDLPEDRVFDSQGEQELRDLGLPEYLGDGDVEPDNDGVEPDDSLPSSEVLKDAMLKSRAGFALLQMQWSERARLYVLHW